MESIENESKQTNRWLIPVLICVIGGFLSTLSSSSVNVALSPIKQYFNTDMNTIQWVVTIYNLALGIIVPISGWLGNRLGYKRVFISALLTFTIGSLLCTFSWNIYSLIVMRVIQALGGGLIMPVAAAMIKSTVPKERFSTAMGIYGIAMLMGPALGPTLGGYLVEYVDWRWIFMLNLPIGALGLLLAFLFLPEFPSKKGEKFDLPGAITSATMLFCLLLALSKGSDWGWTSESIVFLFYISTVALILFIYLELTAKNPLLELRLFRYRSLTMANLITITITIGLYSIVYYIPIFMQSIRGLGAFETGMLMLPGAIVSGIMMLATGKLYNRIGPKIMAVLGLLILTATTYLFSRIDIATSTGAITLWTAMRYFGMSFVQITAATAAMESVPMELTSHASAINNIITRVSSSFGIAILTNIMTNKNRFYTVQMQNSITATNIGANNFLHTISFHLSGYSAVDVKLIGVELVRKLIAQTAFVKALDDIFVIATCITLVSIIPALFLKKTNIPGRV